MLKTVVLPKDLQPALYRDYLAAREVALSLFGGHFADSAARRERAGRVASSYRGDRGRLVAMLLDYNRRMGCTALVEAQIAKLADRESVAVIAGQQAGLCTGPLYTVYKALTAVKLAGRLEEELARPVVPVFWIAGEDHDFAEANHFWLTDKENRLQKVSLDLPHQGEPVGMLNLDAKAVNAALADLDQATMATEFKEDIMAMLRETAAPSASPAEWFARVMAGLFGETGLVLFDPLLPESRLMLSPFFRLVVERNREAAAALLAREAEITAAGYHLQVEREEEGSLLMFMGERRTALLRQGDSFGTRDGATVFVGEQILDTIREKPRLFSPNVLLRPPAQDFLFPTLAYIPGAGELSYFAQLLPLYGVFGLTPPLLWPRAGLTIVEPRLGRHLERYGIPGEDIFSSLDRRLERAVRERTAVDIEGLFASLQGKIKEEYAFLAGELARLDSGLAGLTAKNLQRVLKETGYLEQRARQAARRKNDAVVGHFAGLERSLLPHGRLQERTLNLFPFLIKYGPDFRQKLWSEFPDQPGHYLFYYNPE
jgi:bacillithiol biosynthesis cysteine-adding enzyme BshC